MIAREQKQIRVSEFDSLYEAGTYGDDRVEYIVGEVIVVPSNILSSQIALLIGHFILTYLLEHDIGFATGEGGGYEIGDERFAPDVAVVLYTTQKQPTSKGYNPNPPDLAVEVISNPSNKQEQTDLRRKLSSYLAANVVVWVIDPEARIAEIHQAGQPVKIVDEDSVLTAVSVLPNFELKLSAVLPKESDTE